jgi:hypothetical protein
MCLQLSASQLLPMVLTCSCSPLLERPLYDPLYDFSFAIPYSISFGVDLCIEQRICQSFVPEFFVQVQNLLYGRDSMDLH